jgi:hypothetical protein
MDYVVSLGFKMTELGLNISSVAKDPMLKGNDRIGLVGIQTSDNGKSITHALGWDMEAKLNRYNQRGTHMSRIMSAAGYSSSVRQTSPTIPYSPNVNMGIMGNTYTELKNKFNLQSSIMFALGEWFDGVQAQVSTPSVYKTIDFTDAKGKGLGALAKPLPLITPFENAFNNLGLTKKLVKQLTDPKTGLLAQSNNTRHGGGGELWLFNTPYVFANQLARAVGKASTHSDREKMLKYFYNQGSYLQDYNDPKSSMNYSGPRPFRYFGFPQSSILGATRYPQSSLATASGTVNIPAPIDDYKYSNNGSAPQWQTIADPSAILEFSGKTATPLWMIRSLSQYGSAKKVSSRMRVNKISGVPVVFPNL